MGLLVFKTSAPVTSWWVGSIPMHFRHNITPIVGWSKDIVLRVLTGLLLELVQVSLQRFFISFYLQKRISDCSA